MLLPEGLLWCDSSDVPLEDKIHSAIQAYIAKWNKDPSSVFVSAAMFEPELLVDGIPIKAKDNLPNGYIWTGDLEIEEQQLVLFEDNL